MAKKTLKKYLTENEMAKEYKWEFIRRNKSYQTEWENLTAILQKAEDSKNSGQNELSPNEEAESFHRFLEKWSLSHFFDLPNPQKDYKSLTNREKLSLQVDSTHPAKSLYAVLHDGVKQNIKDKVPPKSRYGPWTGLDDQLNHLQIKIDVRKPKKQIMRELSFILDAIKLYRKWKGMKTGYKPRLDNYSIYLKAYELRNEGLSWIKIAALLQPKPTSNRKTYGNESYIQFAKRAYASCKKMIESGYKDLC